MWGFYFLVFLFCGEGWGGVCGFVPVFDTQSTDSETEQNQVLWKGISSGEEEPEFMINF